MRKRGRPRTNGKQPAGMFFRMMFALYAYNEARRAGVNHSSAILEPVCFVQSQFPQMPISETGVDYEDFSFYRMEVVDVYYVGGFGVMGWISASDYTQARPDPLADPAAEMLMKQQ